MKTLMAFQSMRSLFIIRILERSIIEPFTVSFVPQNSEFRSLKHQKSATDKGKYVLIWIRLHYSPPKKICIDFVQCALVTLLVSRPIKRSNNVKENNFLAQMNQDIRCKLLMLIDLKHPIHGPHISQSKYSGN